MKRNALPFLQRLAPSSTRLAVLKKPLRAARASPADLQALVDLGDHDVPAAHGHDDQDDQRAAGDEVACAHSALEAVRVLDGFLASSSRSTEQVPAPAPVPRPERVPGLRQWVPTRPGPRRSAARTTTVPKRRARTLHARSEACGRTCFFLSTEMKRMKKVGRNRLNQCGDAPTRQA